MGEPIDAGSTAVRQRVGYMSQAFSLYEELSVRQNLVLHAQLYQLGANSRAAIDVVLQQFELADPADATPAPCPWAYASACNWPPPACTARKC